VAGECVDMGNDSGPNIEALRRSAEAEFGGVFRRGISGKIFLGEIFSRKDIEIDSENGWIRGRRSISLLETRPSEL